MMKEEIKVPSMGESISEATIGEILIASGSSVNTDDEILELETDKVNQVLYSPASGTLNLTVNTDDIVKIGDVIGYVDTEGKEEVKKEEKKEPKIEHKEEKPTPTKVEKKEVKAAPPQPEKSARWTKESFIEEVQGKKFPAETEVIEKRVVKPKEGESRQRMTKIRKTIASRLVEAQATTAMLTTFNEVDMSQVMRLRSEYKEEFQKKHGVKLGFMSFFVKACVDALKAVPRVNAYINGDEFVQRHYYHIGIAVGTERGLIVPVVRDCDELSYADIEKAISNYAQKAREGGLSVDDLQGGGFTITNGGIYGSLLSTPILNTPQSGILGMHKIEKRAVVVDDQIVIRPMMYLALSYDHRIIDGKEAVTFLVHVKNSLEDPARSLLEV